MTNPRNAGLLGRAPYDAKKPALRLTADNFPTLPPTPQTRNWLTKVPSYPMYGNDQYGDCVWAMIGHAIEVWTAWGGTEVSVSTAALLKAYSDVTGFNPNDPNTDQGTNVADALNYWRKTGIAGHKIVAFASIDPKNVSLVKAATELFGCTMQGVNFPKIGMTQFNQHNPWTVVSDDGGIEGGHAILFGAFDPSNGASVTWGAIQPQTLAWFDKYTEELWVVITQEWLDANGNTPQGYSLYALGEDFAALTGDPNPFPAPAPSPTPAPTPTPTPTPTPEPTPTPTPTPTPVPSSDPAGDAFWNSVRGWAMKRRVCNKAIQTAILKWAKDTNRG